MKFIKVTIALVALSCANLAAARTRGVEGGNENQKQRALSPSGKGKEKVLIKIELHTGSVYCLPFIVFSIRYFLCFCLCFYVLFGFVIRWCYWMMLFDVCCLFCCWHAFLKIRFLMSHVSCLIFLVSVFLYKKFRIFLFWTKCFEDCKDSLTYYKRDNYPDFRPFSYAIENTPPGCILAPVRNDADIREIRSAISSTTVPSDSWIGIGKTIDDIQDDTSGNRRYEDWFNLDGTPVPATSTIWRSADPAQPNGSITGPNYQTRAVFNVLAGTGGGLADASPETANYVSGAIYKCCFDPCNVGASVWSTRVA